MHTPYSTVLLNAIATDEASGSVGPAILARKREHTFQVNWGTSVSAGVVEIESADSDAYTGTWAPLATVTFSGTAPKSDVVNVTGSFLALRARISTAISGGTVTVTYIGN